MAKWGYEGSIVEDNVAGEEGAPEELEVPWWGSLLRGKGVDGCAIKESMAVLDGGGYRGAVGRGQVAKPEGVQEEAAALEFAKVA